MGNVQAASPDALPLHGSDCRDGRVIGQALRPIGRRGFDVNLHVLAPHCCRRGPGRGRGSLGNPSSAPAMHYLYLLALQSSSTICAFVLFHRASVIGVAICRLSKYIAAMDIRQQLVDEIDTFLARHLMTAADFGIAAMRDIAFVYKLRKGRDVRVSTVDRVRKYMAGARAPRPTPVRLEKRG